MNEFLLTYPTWVKTAATSWSSTSSNGVRVTTDPSKIDLASGIENTIKMEFSNEDSSYSYIDFSSGLTPFTMGVDDVWLLPFYLDSPTINEIGKVTIRISSSVANLNTIYREVSWTTTRIKYGWQVLCAKHTEVGIGLNQYGTVGTVYTKEGNWFDYGGFNSSSTIGAIQIRFENFKNCNINIGSIWKAPSGWAKAVIMLGVDDVPHSFIDLVLPKIEAYGWKCVFNVTINNSLTASNTMLKDVLSLQKGGHEIWGHGRSHFRFQTEPTVEDKYDYFLKKKFELTQAQSFWTAHGVTSAAKCMVLPHNAYDEETFNLLRVLDYKLARSSSGYFHTSWLPGISRYTLPSFSSDTPNSWSCDSLINGGILRGQSMIFYGHAIFAGGASSNTYPQATSSYEDHWTRWLALIKQKETEGKVVVTTPLDYFKRCGIDVFADNFVE